MHSCFDGRVADVMHQVMVILMKLKNIFVINEHRTKQFWVLKALLLKELQILASDKLNTVGT